MKKFFLLLAASVLMTSVAFADNLPYLNFTAKGADMTLGMTIAHPISVNNPNIDTIMLETSFDRVTWTSFRSSTTKVLIPQNSTLYIRTASTTPRAYINTSGSKGWAFEMTGDGTIEADGTVMSLLDQSCAMKRLQAENALALLFYDCAKLIKAPQLTADTLSMYCYYSMFERSGITAAPELPAKKLAYDCYCYMFRNCNSLTKAPALPATNLAEYCYNGMFFSCSNLVEAPELPATKLARGCYESMFNSCTSLAVAPTLPATTLAEYCYSQMFSYCRNLKEVTVSFSEWNPTNATDRWMSGASTTGTFHCPASLDTTKRGATYILSGWTCVLPAPDTLPYLNFTAKGADMTLGMTIAHPEGTYPIQDTIMLETSFDRVTWTSFESNTTKVLIPKNSTLYVRTASTTPIEYINISWSKGWAFEMTGDSTIEANGTVMSLLDQSCAKKRLTANNALALLFYNCAKLTKAPQLTADTLSEYCYYSMFEGSGITAAPELPSRNLANCCYFYMFRNCYSLISASELPATTLASTCYDGMFMNCSSLTNAPALPATTLAYSCYTNMFNGCTSLTVAPKLPAPTLVDYCYQRMFRYCSKLQEVTVGFSEWNPSSATSNWLDGVAATGKFRCPAELDTTKRGASNIPTGWTIQQLVPDTLPYLNFTAKGADMTLGMTIVHPITVNNPAIDTLLLETSFDRVTWTPFKSSTTKVLIPQNSTLYMRTVSDTPVEFVNISQSKGWAFEMTGDGTIEADGTVMSLLDKTCAKKRLTAECALALLFYDCAKLTKAPQLTADTLSMYCCYSMFEHSGITATPELSAKTLAYGCYTYMFRNCYSLVSASELLATKLAKYCYNSMFWNCTTLTKAPSLPATQLENGCYEGMFKSCSSLTVAPELPATTLAAYCYDQMFRYCSKLQDVSVGFSEWNPTNATDNWLDGVAATGTFHCPADLDISVRGISTIPTGWNVVSPKEIVLDFSTMASKHSAYTDTWTYDGIWKLFAIANNNGGWDYAKAGGKNTYMETCNVPTITLTPKVECPIQHIDVTTAAGSFKFSGMKVNYWGAVVYSDAAMTHQIDSVLGGTIIKDTMTYTLVPTNGTEWPANSYYKVFFNVGNTTSTNGIICISKVTLSAFEYVKPEISVSQLTIGYTQPVVGESPSNLTITTVPAAAVANDITAIWTEESNDSYVPMTTTTFQGDKTYRLVWDMTKYATPWLPEGYVLADDATIVIDGKNYLLTETQKIDSALTMLPSYPKFKVSSYANNADFGNTTGWGTYTCKDTITLIATPNKGYKFVNWTEDTVVVSTNAVYTFMTDHAVKYIANFVETEVTATASDNLIGMVTDTVTTGNQHKLTAMPNAGANFIGWYVADTLLTKENPYAFVPETDMQVVAKFEWKTYTVTVKTDTTMGTITGAGTYNYGATVTLSAMPKYGYKFIGWMKNGEPMSGAESTLTFMVTEDVQYSASFGKLQYVVRAKSCDETMGYVSGSGTYEYNASVHITATPNNGYTFVAWTRGTDTVSTENPYKMIVTETDTTLVAQFKLNSYTVTIQYDAAMGTVSGNGVYSYGDVVSLEATPAYGYRFVGWEKDDVIVSTDLNYSFVCSRTVVFKAVFEKIVCTIEVHSNDSTKGMVSGSGTYDYGTMVTITATPNDGYKFAYWDSNIYNGRRESTLTIEVTEDLIFVAYFEAIAYTISATANNAAMGSVTGAGTYNYGSDVTLTATPNEGYEFVNWTIDGAEVSTEATYIFTVTADVTLVANFKKIESALEDIQGGKNATKIIRNGQLYIIRDGITYDIKGREIR